MITLKSILASDLKEIQEQFDMGLLTPREKWLHEFEAKKAYRMYVRMTKN